MKRFTFCLVFLLVAVNLASPTSNRPMVTVLEEMAGDFGACMGTCVASDIGNLIAYGMDTCAPIIGKANQMPFTSEAYCGFIKEFSEDCLGKFFTSQTMCKEQPWIGAKIAEIMKSLRDFACSGGPTLVECMMNVPYEDINMVDHLANCTSDIEDRFLRHFGDLSMPEVEQGGNFAQGLEGVVEALGPFYDKEILENGGNMIYKDVPQMVKCLVSFMNGVNVPSGNCGSVAEKISAEVESIMEYIQDKDMLKCVLKPALVERGLKCGEALANDVMSTVLQSGATQEQGGEPGAPPADGGSGDADGNGISTHMESNPFGFLENIKYSDFSSGYSTFKDCVLGALEAECPPTDSPGNEWMNANLKRHLDAFSAIIDSDGKQLAPFCSAVTVSGGIRVRFDTSLRTLLSLVPAFLAYH